MHLSSHVRSENRPLGRNIPLIGFRVRTLYSYQMTVAATQMAIMKFLMFRSKRVAMRRQALKRRNMRSTTLSCL